MRFAAFVPPQAHQSPFPVLWYLSARRHVRSARDRCRRREWSVCCCWHWPNRTRRGGGRELADLSGMAFVASRPRVSPRGAVPLAELRRDMERRRLVSDQIRQIENVRLEHLKQAPSDGPHAMVRLLARVIGVGIETADMLVQEVLSRNMRDRRAIARYAGLTGSPDEIASHGPFPSPRA